MRYRVAHRPKPGTIARRAHYRRVKRDLEKQLGGKCVDCGGTVRLTFDHIHGRDWDIRRVHATKRLRIYQEEADAGLLQLLCLWCNSRKGQPADPDVPF